MNVNVEVLSSIKDPRGFEIRTERLTAEENLPSVDRQATYTLSGDYIGDVETAVVLIGREIQPEKITPDRQICQIGFCPSEQKWYGWSHRAIHGFEIGDMTEAIEGWEKCFPVAFQAKTLDDCKRLAIAFAESVA